MFWNGLGWSIQPTPNPVSGGDLEGVSCTATTSCTAVGWTYDDTALAERWDGLAWSAQPTPHPSRARDSALLDVSCASATSCMAVGSSHRAGTEVTLAEDTDGSSWTVLKTPIPASGRGNELDSVSCVSVTDCFAVGQYAPRGGPIVPLAEHWDGSHWALQKAAKPKRGKDSGLFGVSCISARACIAVGEYTDGAGTEVTLAEHWNGIRWTVQETPNPAHSTNSGFTGMSCVAAIRCVAVGSFINRTGTSLPLAERYS
jgi:hypothetical protein